MTDSMTGRFSRKSKNLEKIIKDFARNLNVIYALLILYYFPYLYCLDFIFQWNKLNFQISGKSRFGGPTHSRAPPNLTKHPIGLKIVAN